MFGESQRGMHKTTPAAPLRLHISNFLIQNCVLYCIVSKTSNCSRLRRFPKKSNIYKQNLTWGSPKTYMKRLLMRTLTSSVCWTQASYIIHFVYISVAPAFQHVN